MLPRHALPLDIRFMNWVASALFLILVLLALGSAALWAARHPAWTLNRIVVDGEVAHQNAATFRAQLLPRLVGSYLTIDLQDVKHQFEAVPWVRQAVVRREFPNRLHVTLQEHEAVAWWGEVGGGRLVSRQGAVFEANPEDAQADGWAELAGPEGQSGQVYALYRELQPLLAPLEQNIERLELVASGDWKIWLDGGTVIELGRGQPEELLARARLFNATVAQLNERYGRRRLEVIDLRYPSGYAVRMRGVKTVTDDKAAQAARKK